MAVAAHDHARSSPQARRAQSLRGRLRHSFRRAGPNLARGSGEAAARRASEPPASARRRADQRRAFAAGAQGGSKRAADHLDRPAKRRRRSRRKPASYSRATIQSRSCAPFPAPTAICRCSTPRRRGIGSINLSLNRDGVVRQVPLFFRLGDQIVPSLAAEALRVAQGASTYILKSSNASGETAFGQSTGLNHVRIGKIEIATDAEGAVSVKFRHSNPAAFIPAWKVIAGEVEERRDRRQDHSRRLQHARSARSSARRRSTRRLPGVEIQAQIIEHILAGRRLTRPDYASASSRRSSSPAGF